MGEYADAYIDSMIDGGWGGGRSRHRPRQAPLEVRQARCAAHAAFDVLWKSGRMTRSEAYSWLAAKMGLREAACHISLFGVEQCREVERICLVEDFEDLS